MKGFGLLQRNHGLILLIVILIGLVASPVMAIPTIFTDRAAFDATVGETTLITFDTIPPIECEPNCSHFASVTYDNLLIFSGDLFSVVPQIGNYCFCDIYQSGGGTINPVLAFGVDINTGGPIVFDLAGFTFQLSQPQFLGFLFDTPTVVEISPYPTDHGFSCCFTVDNVALKTVPEPSSLLLLAAGLAGLAWWRWKHAA